MIALSTFLIFFAFTHGDANSLELNTVFQNPAGDNSAPCYRIPTILSTKNSLLAFAEQRLRNCGDSGQHNLVLRRSLDLGETWGPIITIAEGNDKPFSNPNPAEVDLQNGKTAILLHFDTKNNPTPWDYGRNMQVWSYDDGLTWNNFEDITNFMPAGHEGCMPGPSVGVQSTKGTVYFSCHGPGKGADAFLYWSRFMDNPSPVYSGESPAARARADIGRNMLIISESPFIYGGRIDEIELYASRAEDALQVNTWREVSHLKYKKMGAVVVSVKKGYNKIALKTNETIAVAPRDVLGWYCQGPNPIVYEAGNVVVRRAYVHSYSRKEVDMAEHRKGWERAYSLRVRVRRQIGDYWETSQPVSNLDECSIALVMDDNIMMNCRTMHHARAQLIWSRDGSLVSPVEYPSGLIDANCQGSLLSFGGALYLSQDPSNSRANLTVKRSVNNGDTWEIDQILWTGPSGYSQLTSWRLHIGVLFEHGDIVTPERISFAKWKVDPAIFFV